jgi:naphthalene 1,2-dioxygenase system ferredoxin subunit
MPWHKVIAADDLPAGEALGLVIEERDIGLFHVGEAFYATDNLCTHAEAFLSDGFIEGCEIECPLHQGRFDLRTGEPRCAPVTKPIRTYPVKIEGGEVFVEIED